MWEETRLKKRLRIAYPIIQAPMAGGATTPELVAAASNAGALGSLGAGYMNASSIRQTIQAIKGLTKQPYAVNLFIPAPYHVDDETMQQACHAAKGACSELGIEVDSPTPPYAVNFEDQITVIVEEQVPVFSFTFGLLEDHWLDVLKKNNTKLLGTATTLKEAKALEEGQVDAIVLQGSEAGGHRGTFIGEAEDALESRDSLLLACLNEVKVPLVVSGGLMTGEQCASVLRQGADGVQLGTRFLVSHESGIHASYKRALLEAKEDNTVLTRAFSGKLARGILNTFIEKMEGKPVLDYPVQNALTSTMRREAGDQNNAAFQSLWAGTGVSHCQAESTSDIIKDLIQEIEKHR